jgi:hypothetical protein
VLAGGEGRGEGDVRCGVPHDLYPPFPCLLDFVSYQHPITTITTSYSNISLTNSSP